MKFDIARELLQAPGQTGCPINAVDVKVIIILIQDLHLQRQLDDPGEVPPNCGEHGSD